MRSFPLHRLSSALAQAIEHQVSLLGAAEAPARIYQERFREAREASGTKFLSGTIFDRPVNFSVRLSS